MPRILTGTVVSTAMTNTIVVEVTRHVPHPLYKKLQKRSKKHKADNAGQEVVVGQRVKIIETKPLSKGKHFKLFTEDVKEAPVAKKSEEKEVKAKTKKEEKAK